MVTIVVLGQIMNNSDQHEFELRVSYLKVENTKIYELEKVRA